VMASNGWHNTRCRIRPIRSRFMFWRPVIPLIVMATFRFAISGRTFRWLRSSILSALPMHLYLNNTSKVR
jgi:hypothetical protein